MKNRKLVILGMVCALAAMPVAVFGSGSNSISSGSNSNSNSGQTSQVIEQGKGETVQNNNQNNNQNSQETTTVNSGTITPATNGTTAVSQVVDTTKNSTQVTTDANSVQTTNASTATATTDGYYLGLVTNGTNASGNAIATDAAGHVVVDGTTIVVAKKENGSDLSMLGQAAQNEVKQIAQTRTINMAETAGFTVRDSISIKMEKNGVEVNETKIVPIKWTAAPTNAANMMAVCIRPDNTKVIVPIVSVQNGIVNVSVTGSGYIVLLTK